MSRTRSSSSSQTGKQKLTSYGASVRSVLWAIVAAAVVFRASMWMFRKCARLTSSHILLEDTATDATRFSQHVRARHLMHDDVVAAPLAGAPHARN